MAEDLHIDRTNKEAVYSSLLPQLKALCEGESNRVANLANITAGLKEALDYFWIGFYLVENDDLVLGPFQGPIACTRIKKGKGVCGTAWERNSVILVPDVDKFPGHIACSSASKSEIVVPIIKNSTVIGVLDVDSNKLDDFDVIDEKYLKDLCEWLAKII
ncbi:MAG: GAF domain-containing protein [Brumimicrobium sp.]|nr:GAF domain-containing protein [Brumimicrobium sp.]